MNHLVIRGNLGRDPESLTTKTDVPYVRMTVAAKMSTKKDSTIWWNVTIWGSQFSKIIAFLKKGSCVIVSGDMGETSTFTDRSGQLRISHNMTAHSISFGGGDGGDKKDPHAIEEVPF